MNSVTGLVFGQILFLIALFLFIGLGMWLVHNKKTTKDNKDKDKDISMKD